jgi:hypothetical protein
MTETKFKPGHDPRRNTKGRPKGKQNKSTEQIRQALQLFITKNLSGLQTDFNELETARERLAFIEKLIKHVLPPPLQPLEKLTEEQITDIINQLKQGML